MTWGFLSFQPCSLSCSHDLNNAAKASVWRARSASSLSTSLLLKSDGVDGVLESYIRQAAFKELSKETMEMLKEPWLREGGKKGFIRQLCQANLRNTDAVEGRYHEVGESMPVKIIWGENDDWISVNTAKRLGDALKAKEVVIIAEAGHLIMYDQPAQLGVELGRWLTSV
jgi:pimeloyl-ACP methyl ester carboxylesterase